VHISNPDFEWVGKGIHNFHPDIQKSGMLLGDPCPNKEDTKPGKENNNRNRYETILKEEKWNQPEQDDKNPKTDNRTSAPDPKDRAAPMIVVILSFHDENHLFIFINGTHYHGFGA
jgi:hypothetical protein